MCWAPRRTGSSNVEFLTPWRLLALGFALAVLFGSRSVAWAEDVGGKANSGASAKSGRHRKPYPPLRTASGQPAASAAHSTTGVPPLRGAVDGSPSSSSPAASAASTSAKSNPSVPPLRDASAGAPQLVVDGKSYLMIGRGDLAASATPSYQASLYLEHVGARAQFGSLTTRAPTRAMLMSESRAQYFVIWGRFAKLVVLRLTKPATKAELSEMFRSSMSPVFADRAPVDLRKDAEALTRLIDRDLAEGQELRVHISDLGQIDLYLDGQKFVGPQNAKLARHILEIWLGYHSAARSLRQVLVDKIEVLKTPVARSPK